MLIKNELSHKVVLIVDEKKHLKKTENGFFLRTKLLKDRKVLEDYTLTIEDKTGKLANTPSAFSLGSGFFIAKNIIATAAHVPLEATRYKSTSLKDIRFINCFHDSLQAEMERGKEIFIPNENIFKPMKGYEELTTFEYSGRSQDWALIPVSTLEDGPADRPFIEPNFKIIKAEEKVTWIGHPLGLPVSTISDYQSLNVIRADEEQLFEIENLSFAGLSGAPVIQGEQVVGILARGMGQFDVDKEKKTVRLVQPFLGKHEGSE